MIVYLGNKLAHLGKNPTSIDTLGNRLKKLYPELISVSKKRFFLFRLLNMWWTIISNRKKINLVIIDTYSTLAFHFAWSSAFICKIFSIPYLPIIHGGDFERRIEKSKSVVNNYLKSACLVVTPSSFLSRIILSKLKYPTHIIPNSIDFSSFDSSYQVTFQSTPQIFWLRAYQELYNPILAIEILYELRTNYGIEAKLTMVGPDKDGSLSTVKQKIREYNLEENVKVFEGMPQKEWVELARNCTVFLNTTKVDNSPVSLIEAMAFGLPVVSTSVGGIPDLIKDQEEGFLFPSGDATKAAKLIRALHEDEKFWKKASDLAIEKSMDFDWENSIKQKWITLLDKYER